MTLVVSGFAAAGPTVESVVPGVGPRGGEFTVVITGGRLKDACDLLFYDQGLTLGKLEVVSENEVKATLSAAADCPIGPQRFRLRTRSGLSELRLIEISPFPVIAETEPNDTPKQAQEVVLNTTLAGVIDSGDVDCFAITLKKGQRLAAEVQAIRLGGEMTDTVLAILDPADRVVAQVDDTGLARQDPFASITAPCDGRFTIMVRETAFGGGPTGTYALHVGLFPRPTSLYPPGGEAGKESRLKLAGADDVDPTVLVRIPEVKGPWWDYFPEGIGAKAPTSTQLRVRSYPSVDEVASVRSESPQSPERKAHQWPVAFHGAIGLPGEVDVHSIETRAGDAIRVEVFAERVGSPLDSIIAIIDPHGDVIARGDDDECRDSLVVFNARSAGAHRIEISDKRRSGGASFVYRIEVEKPTPGLEAFLASPVRKSQSGQVIAVPRGNRVLAHVGVRRDGFDSPVRLEVTGLPQRVTIDVGAIATGEYLTPIVVEAAPDAPLGAALATVRCVAVTPQGTIEGGFRQTVDLLPAPGDGSYRSTSLDRLAFVVTEEAPYRVNLSAPKAILARDGAIEIVARVERAHGFETAVEVSLPYLPPGVEIEGPIVLPPNESAAVFRLFARPDADLVSWRLAAQVKTAPPRLDRRAMTMALQNTINTAGAGRRRRAPIEAGPEVSSTFTPIELSTSRISGRFDPATVEQGKTVVVRCHLNISSPLTDPMEASLEGLPPRAAAKPVKVNPGTDCVEFSVSVAETTPIGEHNSLFCRLTQKVGEERPNKAGGTLIYQVGRGASLKVAAPGAVATDSDGKPLSPLETLRRKEGERSKKP